MFAALASEERYRARHVIVPSSEARVLKHFDLNSGFDLPTVVLCDLRGLAPSVGDDEVVLDDSRDAHVHAKKAFAYRLRDWQASNIVDHDTYGPLRRVLRWQPHKPGPSVPTHRRVPGGPTNERGRRRKKVEWSLWGKTWESR